MLHRIPENPLLEQLLYNARKLNAKSSTGTMAEIGNILAYEIARGKETAALTTAEGTHKVLAHQPVIIGGTGRANPLANGMQQRFGGAKFSRYNRGRYSPNIEGQDVILVTFNLEVEDLHTVEHIMAANPKSVTIATVFAKPEEIAKMQDYNHGIAIYAAKVEDPRA
jgi:uracil phosphoribosyltransferase